MITNRYIKIAARQTVLQSCLSFFSSSDQKKKKVLRKIETFAYCICIVVFVWTPNISAIGCAGQHNSFFSPSWRKPNKMVCKWKENQKKWMTLKFLFFFFQKKTTHILFISQLRRVTFASIWQVSVRLWKNWANCRVLLCQSSIYLTWSFHVGKENWSWGRSMTIVRSYGKPN